MRRTTVTAALVSTLAVASIASPATADTTTFDDSRGDAPARYDLTRVSVNNGTDRVVVAQRVRNLRGGRTQIYGFNVSASGEQYLVQTVRRKNGKVSTRLIASRGELECNVRAKWRLKANSIRVVTPRACIMGTGALRVSAMMGAGNGTSGDPMDWTKTVRIGQF